MEPKWKALESRPVSNAEAASILRDYVRKAGSVSTAPADTEGSERAGGTKRNIANDIRKLSHAVEALAAREEQPRS